MDALYTVHSQFLIDHMTHKICRETHMIATLKGFKGPQYVAQTMNQSGEPDGKPMAEDRDLVLLSNVNEIIKL